MVKLFSTNQLSLYCIILILMQVMMCFATAKGEGFISGKLRMKFERIIATLHLWLLYTEQCRYPIEESSYRLGLEGLK